jgi:outer membrane receptor protein involved in Fe transport
VKISAVALAAALRCAVLDGGLAWAAEPSAGDGRHAGPLQAEPAAAALEPIADEVVVTITRHEPRTAGTVRVTAREFAFVPRRTAEDMLELVPGLTLVQHGSEGKGHQFFLRGFDAIHGADLELTVEGVPVNEWSNIHAQGYIDLGFVIPELVSAVEVTKGPFSIDQGAFAMAGSAQYSLGVPLSELGTRATYTAGTTNRQRGLVTHSPQGGDGSTFLAAELLHDDGFGQNRGIERANLLGQATLLDSEALGTLRALGSVYLARFELPGALRSDDVEAGRIGFYDAYDRGAGGSSRRMLGALAYESQRAATSVRATLFGAYRELGLLENFTGYLLDPISGDRRDQHQSNWSVGSSLDLGLRVMRGLRVDSGLGMRGDVFEQRQEHVDQERVVLGRERELAGEQALFYAKLGVVLEPLAELRIRAGARADVARVVARDPLAVDDAAGGTLAALSPRLSVDARLSPWLTLFGAYGRGFRPPEARAFSSFEPARTGLADDVYTGGEPTMTSTDSFELGGRYGDPARRWTVGMAAFATFIERESVYDHVSGVNLELDGTRRLGVELELGAHPFAGLELRGFATLVQARFVRSGNPVPLAPRQTGGFSVIAGREHGPRAGLRGLFVAPRPLPHGARGATLALVDATMGWHWERVYLDVEIENALDLRLREGEYHYASNWRADQPASQIPVLEYVAGPPLNVRVSATVLF